MRNVTSYRMRRINEALKEIIGTALTQELKDPRIGFVTLTGVDTAPDLVSRQGLRLCLREADREGFHHGGPAGGSVPTCSALSATSCTSSAHRPWNSCTTPP